MEAPGWGGLAGIPAPREQVRKGQRDQGHALHLGSCCAGRVGVGREPGLLGPLLLLCPGPSAAPGTSPWEMCS